jgi:hypothetical protein
MGFRSVVAVAVIVAISAVAVAEVRAIAYGVAALMGAQ